MHDARAFGRVRDAAAAVLAATGGHTRFELLLGVVLAVIAAVGRRLGARLGDAVCDELLHEGLAGAGRMAGRGALLGGRARTLRAVGDGRAAGVAGGGLLVGAVRGGALEIARLGRCGAALDRAALFAAGPESLLGLRAALLETRRAARRRRGRRGAAGRALQVLRAGGLPALLA